VKPSFNAAMPMCAEDKPPKRVRRDIVLLEPTAINSVVVAFAVVPSDRDQLKRLLYLNSCKFRLRRLRMHLMPRPIDDCRYCARGSTTNKHLSLYQRGRAARAVLSCWQVRSQHGLLVVVLKARSPFSIRARKSIKVSILFCRRP